MSVEPDVAYWNVNLPKDQWTDECPEYLSEVDDWDRAQLAVRDEDYQLMSWEEVATIVHENRLQDFKRIPSQLHRYRRYIADVKRNYGSIMNFILKERVKWADLTPRGDAFQYPDDMCTTYNDWPYGVDAKIVHLVVWVKFGFEEEAATGDLTPAGRKLIGDYVEKTFKSQMPPDHVLWFKNWASLKSVHAIEHFHVMLYDPDLDFVHKITNGDIPASQKTTHVKVLEP